MASSVTPATLTVKISESVILNGSEQGNTNTLTISNVSKISREIFNCDLTENNVVWFTDFDDTIDNASLHNRFERSQTRYVRLTNLDDTNYVVLIIRNAADDETALKLGPGASFIVNGTESGVELINDSNGAAISSITLADLSSINAVANTANCDLEVFVACD